MPAAAYPTPCEEWIAETVVAAEAVGPRVTRRVSFRPEAEAEALETRHWYESRRPGLGVEFRAALDDTIERIADSPMPFRLVRGETRRAILNRFPYAVYFRMAGDDVVVLAIRGRQHSRRWQSRA